MSDSVFIFKLILFLLMLIYKVANSSQVVDKDNKKIKISSRKRMKLLREMAQRGFKQKYYTDPLYSEFEKRVRRYYKVMKNDEGKLSNFALVFLQKIVAEETLFREMFQFLKHGNIGRYFLKAAEYWYAEKAIRSIEDWKPNPRMNLFKNCINLAAFLFEAYPVAKVFRDIWTNWYYIQNYHEVWNPLFGFPKENRIDGALFDLYFHLTKGENVRSWKPEYFKPSKKEAHFWMNTPNDLEIGITESFWRAVYLAKGGINNFGFIYNAPFSFQELTFWRQFIGIIVRDEPRFNLPPNEIGELVHLLQWMKFGKDSGLSGFNTMTEIKGVLSDFSLKRESLASIRKKLYNSVQAEYPLPSGFEQVYVFTSEEGQLYQIKHLRNRWELQKEGGLMENCLADWGYHVSAVKGTSQFWSLRKMDHLPEGTPLVSIEITESEIIEFQAKHNSCPEDHLIAIIEQWAEENELKVSNYEDEY